MTDGNHLGRHFEYLKLLSDDSSVSCRFLFYRPSSTKISKILLRSIFARLTCPTARLKIHKISIPVISFLSPRSPQNSTYQTYTVQCINKLVLFHTVLFCSGGHTTSPKPFRCVIEGQLIFVRASQLFKVTGTISELVFSSEVLSCILRRCGKAREAYLVCFGVERLDKNYNYMQTRMCCFCLTRQEKILVKEYIYGLSI